MAATVLFFVSGVLTIRELEEIPWNIILLFGGAMSMSFCIWETGAQVGGDQWLTLFPHVPGLVFVMALALFVQVVTNFITTAATIAILLPVALVIASYLGVAPEVVLFSTLVAAAMPFLLLSGSAPNAIAYESRQFSAAAFFARAFPPASC